VSQKVLISDTGAGCLFHDVLSPPLACMLVVRIFRFAYLRRTFFPATFSRRHRWVRLICFPLYGNSLFSFFLADASGTPALSPPTNSFLFAYSSRPSSTVPVLWFPDDYCVPQFPDLWQVMHALLLRAVLKIPPICSGSPHRAARQPFW